MGRLAEFDLRITGSAPILGEDIVFAEEGGDLIALDEGGAYIGTLTRGAERIVREYDGIADYATASSRCGGTLRVQIYGVADDELPDLHPLADEGKVPIFETDEIEVLDGKRWSSTSKGTAKAVDSGVELLVGNAVAAKLVGADSALFSRILVKNSALCTYERTDSGVKLTAIPL